MTKFSELGLSQPILDAVFAAGYKEATPIQAGVIPAMLEGDDVVGIAQTGTGKTASFVLPILERLFKTKGRPAPMTARALILAPTRELAAQILESVGTYSKNIKATSTLVVGGQSAFKQIKVISRGVDIVVATPGRLLDHLGAGKIDLSATTTVVLDEADQMMDMGFIPAIREIMAAVSGDKQTLLLSATMPKPIRKLADDFLYDPTEVSVAAQSTPVERIDQRVYAVDRSDKLRSLIDILQKGEVTSAIIFTKTRRGADKVSYHLHKKGFKSGAIHGEKTQKQRDRTMREFKSGKLNLLVATDIAARGLDVDGVSHVINYELPMMPEAYVHRIGRTARAGESGIAISFVDEHQRGELRDIERLIGYAFDIHGSGEKMKLPSRIAQPRPKHKPKKGKKGGKKFDGKKRSQNKRPKKEGGAYRFDGPDFTPEADRAPDGSVIEARGEKKFKRKKRKDKGEVSWSRDSKPSKKGGRRKPSPGERKRNAKHYGKRQKAKAAKK